VGPADYAYDAANQLTLRDADGALTTYSYDANGNLLAQEKATGTTTFTWGYENELLTSLEPDGDLVTMTYDGDLQRRQRVAGATEINFVWDREQVLMELNAAGATAARYTLAPLGYGDLVSQRRWGVSSFYHFDALGTTRRVTAADESTQLTYVRDAFGVGIASTGTTTNRFRYLGKLGYVQEDTLAGALLRRRYYQYEIGRFVSRDPVSDPGRSEYGYVLNAPTRAVDPSGRSSSRKGLEANIGVGVGVPGGAASVSIIQVSDTKGNAGFCTSILLAPVAAGLQPPSLEVVGGIGMPDIPELLGPGLEDGFSFGPGQISGGIEVEAPLTTPQPEPSVSLTLGVVPLPPTALAWGGPTYTWCVWIQDLPPWVGFLWDICPECVVGYVLARRLAGWPVTFGTPWGPWTP
jgi:RHS repeat-associated protein